VKNKKKQLIEMGLIQANQTVHDLFAEDPEVVVALAGEIAMEVPLVWRARRSQQRGHGMFQSDEEEYGRSGAGRMLTQGDIRAIEEELESLAEDILSEWDRRHNQSGLEKAVYEALVTPFDWGDDLHAVLDRGMGATVQVDHTNKMRELLTSITTKLPEAVAERFDVDTMLEGFACFKKLSTKLESSHYL
jgi:hypothetical protein